MSLFSKQQFYCNMCGKEFYEITAGPYNSRVCSRECNEELHYRNTLSILGKQYKPREKGDK